MESTTWNSGTIECAICKRRLPYILVYTWNRPNQYGGKLKLRLCSSCEQEFKRQLAIVQSKARKILGEDVDTWIKEKQKEKELERKQLKLPVV
jgi:hypothetical protein